MVSLSEKKKAKWGRAGDESLDGTKINKFLEDPEERPTRQTEAQNLPRNAMNGGP